MLTFFRKIRKSLIESLPANEDPAKQAGGSAKKYLLYATGEVLLVVIGILIALQINNWNEWRKERVIEQEILNQLYSDLEKTLDDHQRDFKLQTGLLNSTWKIVEFLESPNLNYTYSLDRHFMRSSMDDYSFPISKTYETLKASNSKIISNDSLSILIHLLYEDTYPRLEKNTGYTSDIEELMQPYLKKHFTLGEFDLEGHKAFVESRIELMIPGGVPAGYHRIGYRPLDPEFLKTDPEYRLLIHQTIRLRGFKLATIKRAISQTEQAMSLIKEELGQEEIQHQD